MKFIIEKVSDSLFREEREINTIDELKQLAEEHPGWHGDGDSKELIVHFGYSLCPQATIIIYDDYIE